MASALATLMNHAMHIEREQVLEAESHQPTSDRQGYANGFKPKTLKTRVGQVDMRILQARGCRVQLSEAETHWRSFLQSVLARGMRGIKLVVSDDWETDRAYLTMEAR